MNIQPRSKYGPLMRGDVGSDGRVFWAYHKGKPIWRSAETYQTLLEKQADHYKKWVKRTGYDACGAVAKWRKENAKSFLKWREQRNRLLRERTKGKQLQRAKANLIDCLSRAHFIRHRREGNYLRLVISPSEARALLAAIERNT